jgi:hypothetical protein
MMQGWAFQTFCSQHAMSYESATCMYMLWWVFKHDFQHYFLVFRTLFLMNMDILQPILVRPIYTRFLLQTIITSTIKFRSWLKKACHLNIGHLYKQVCILNSLTIMLFWEKGKWRSIYFSLVATIRKTQLQTCNFSQIFLSVQLLVTWTKIRFFFFQSSCL